MKLYFVAYNREQNLDWFVSAPNAAKALEIWAGHEMVAGYYTPGVDEPPEVFLVPEPGEREKAHGWFVDVKEETLS